MRWWPFRKREQSLDPVAFEQFCRLQPSSIRLTEFLAWDEATREAAVEIAEEVQAERIFALAACVVNDGSRNAMQRRFDPAGADRSLVDEALDMASESIMAEQVSSRQPKGRPLGRRR